MLDSIPANFWLNVIQVTAIIFSSLWLIIQRCFQKKASFVNTSPLKQDTARDINNEPFSNENTLSRIILSTCILIFVYGYILTINLKNEESVIYSVIGSTITFLVGIYSFVLAVTASRFPLPNTIGWELYVHLCIIYTILFISAIINLATLVWNNPTISLNQSFPFVLPILCGFDLVCTTITVKNGSPFLDENGKTVNGSNVESILGRLYFTWITSLIDLINTQASKLSDTDLPTLSTNYRAHNMFYIFKKSRGKGLIRRIYLANQHSIHMQGILGSLFSVLYYATPFFLNRLLLVIQEIKSGKGDDATLMMRGMGYVFGLSAFIIINSLFISQLWFFGQNSQMGVKSMLNIEIYQKMLCHVDTSVLSGNKCKSDEDRDVGSSTGKIVNLMSTDSSRIASLLSSWYVIIQAPMQLALGLYFLFTLLGWSSILGMTVMVITITLNNFNSKLFSKTQDQLMKARDKRVSLMNEMLQGIRQIKFFAWESNWSKQILEARNIELGYLKIVYLSQVIFMFLWQSTPLLVTTIAFWSFTKLEGKELTAPVAFTSVAIFNKLRDSLNVIPETAINWFEAMVSINRIEQYLKEKEIAKPTTSNQKSSTSEIIIGFENATMCWPRSDTKPLEPESDILSREQNTFILKDVDVIFPNNKLSIICGPTGSGKTLLMLSLLGETEIKTGSVFCPQSRFLSSLDSTTAITSIKVSENDDIVPKNWILPYGVAYVSQTPWLQNASIKDNILFGLPLVQKRYLATLTDCALNKDLSYFEDGDLTEIGEKGITLSGGQKARVALARAVYSRAQNIFMDDVLSAVDAHTAKHLYNHCLLGSLMNNRTQILITHHVNLCIHGTSHFVFVKDGSIEFSGAPAAFIQKNQGNLIFGEDFYEEDEAIQVDTKTIVEKPKILVQEENRASGMVKFRLYQLYFKLVGNWFFWIFIFFSIIGVKCLDITASWWVKEWAQSYESKVDGDVISNSSTVSEWPGIFLFSTENKNSNLNKYLGIYVLLNSANIILGITRYSVMFWGGIAASKKLYILLLNRVFYAPLRFFDTTPVGRIVNRFTKDFEIIDASVPSDIIQFCIQWTTVFSIIFVAIFVLPPLLALMLSVASVNIYFGSRFLSASRELKRLDSVSRSPLFTIFSETIVGITTIRAFGMTQQFMLEMLHRVDMNVRPLFYFWTASRWVSTRIAIMGACIALVTGLAILFNLDHLDASISGFCLTYVLAFTSMTYWGVRRFTALEMSFTSVERVVEFLEIEQEAPAITDKRPPLDWPNQGLIEVKDLHVRYADDLEPVLKGLTFTIKPKEKIGIVGRTGSGKSSLALAIFRFIESYKGSIFIDNVNIADIGTKDLRGNLTIIPQDPVLFSGTIGSNLDPFNEFSKEVVFNALKRVHLLTDASEQVNENPFKNLDTVVNEGGKNFSQGQRQLLCLARALLLSKKIVLMDEATASVDFETDKSIQKTISREFSECTIMCIAHRLNTVIEYDRILVLDHGKIVEFDSPLSLLRDKESVFYKMCRNSGEYETLLKLAKAKHELVDIL